MGINNKKQVLFMKRILQFLIILLFILVTFFGIGPVLMADGSTQERIITLALIILKYIFLIWLFKLVSRWKLNK